MDELDKYLKEVGERESRATIGPWINRPRGVVQSQAARKIIFWDDEPNQGDKAEDIKSNYDFISHSRTDIPKLLEIVGVLKAGIEFALIYNPDVDHYKIKHTAYPKLKDALAKCDAISGGE